MNKLLNTKKWNIIITSAILLVAVIVTIITGITFKSFSKYETFFSITLSEICSYLAIKV